MDNDVTAGSEAAYYSTFDILRALFITGCVLGVILWFVPLGKVTGDDFFIMDSQEQTFSMFSMVRFISQRGYIGLAMFLVLIFYSYIVFIVLALVLPRRWVFVTASSVEAFFILFDFFSGSSKEITYFLVPGILEWVSSFLILLGFFIKPPVCKTDVQKEIK